MLRLFNLELHTTVETNASDYAIGACLSQIDENGKRKLVTFYLRKLIALELNYDVYDKELLAIIVAFKH